MQSLSVYARLFARAINGTEAENILFNGLIRLSSSSSSSVHITQSSTRLAITYPSSAISRAVHLVTASSGYSNHDNNENEYITKTRRKNSLIEQRTNQTNVYGDDAFFVTKHRLGDFLGIEYFLSKKKIKLKFQFLHIQVWLMVLGVGVNMVLIHHYFHVH
jgi:hypothetical protein